MHKVTIVKSLLLTVPFAAKMVCGHLSIQAVVSAEAFFVQKRLSGFCCASANNGLIYRLDRFCMMVCPWSNRFFRNLGSQLFNTDDMITFCFRSSHPFIRFWLLLRHRRLDVCVAEEESGYISKTKNRVINDSCAADDAALLVQAAL